MKSPTLLLGLTLLAMPVWLNARELPVVPPAQAGLSESKLGEVDQFMERQVADQKIAGGIVIVSHGGKIGFFRTYGLRDIVAQKPMEQDTIFRIYSMSKAITTAAALQLHDAGKLKLDDPVAKYIPSFAHLKVAAAEGLRAPTRAITVKDLMLHVSGLTYGDGPQATKDAYKHLKPFESTNLVELVDRIVQVPLAFDPGTTWSYGTGIDVLGRVIEVVSGESLDAYLANHLFKPLDMKDTGFVVPAEKLDRLAANYTRTPDGLKLTNAISELLFSPDNKLFSGGGGLVSTARDYMRFLRMIEQGGKLDGQRLLKAQAIKLMTSNQLPPEAFPIRFGKEMRYGTGFGLGFNVRTEITTWDPAGHVGEYGWGGAASTHYWASPKDRLIVITLEQIMPYQWDTERGVKALLYDAVTR